MIRKAFVASPSAGWETKCQHRRNPFWRELLDTLKVNGSDNYSIFLHPETRQLFGYAESKMGHIGTPSPTPGSANAPGNTWPISCPPLWTAARNPLN